MTAIPTILLSVCCLANSASAATNLFCVFDNGLQGENLTTIDAQLDLVKKIGFDGLTWRTDSPERIKQLLAGAKQRGLTVCAIYANLDLKDGKLVYDPRVREIIPL
jgi:sugar phosphate isomerase/epimerase